MEFCTPLHGKGTVSNLFLQIELFIKNFSYNHFADVGKMVLEKCSIHCFK